MKKLFLVLASAFALTAQAQTCLSDIQTPTPEPIIESITPYQFEAFTYVAPGTHFYNTQSLPVGDDQVLIISNVQTPPLYGSEIRIALRTETGVLLGERTISSPVFGQNMSYACALIDGTTARVVISTMQEEDSETDYDFGLMTLELSDLDQEPTFRFISKDGDDTFGEVLVSGQIIKAGDSYLAAVSAYAGSVVRDEMNQDIVLLAFSQDMQTVSYQTIRGTGFESLIRGGLFATSNGQGQDVTLWFYSKSPSLAFGSNENAMIGTSGTPQVLIEASFMFDTNDYELANSQTQYPAMSVIDMIPDECGITFVTNSTTLHSEGDPAFTTPIVGKKSTGIGSQQYLIPSQTISSKATSIARLQGGGADALVFATEDPGTNSILETKTRIRIVNSGTFAPIETMSDLFSNSVQGTLSDMIATSDNGNIIASITHVISNGNGGITNIPAVLYLDVIYGQQTTGISENKGSAFKAYPNPASESLTLDSPEPVLVELFNLAGQRVASQQVQGNIQNSMSVSALPAGMYTARITNEKQIVTNEKIIVTH